MAVDEFKELRNLTTKSAWLKKLLVERDCEIEVMKEITGKWRAHQPIGLSRSTQSSEGSRTGVPVR
jgi:hypothetical protein